MGVDFRIRLVRDTTSAPIVPEKEPQYSQRLFVLEELFRVKPDGPGIAHRVREWLPPAVSLGWFDDAYNGMGGNRPPEERDTWDPNDVIDAVERLGGILRAHADDLPPFFRFHGPGGRRLGGYRMIVGDRRYLIRGRWGHVLATRVDAKGDSISGDSEAIDLSGQREIRVREMFIPLDPRRLEEDVLGPEFAIAIERETAEHHFRPDLDGMLRVARLALAKRHRLFTSID